MLKWATNKEVNSSFFKNTMAEMKKRYLSIVKIDNLSDFKEWELPFIVKKLTEGKYKKVLDFGTGVSCLPAYLDYLGYNAWALDNGKWHPNMDEEHYNTIYKSKIKYIIDDLIQNPDCVPDKYFDAICSASSLEHMPHPEKYVEILAKKLKKGGLHIHIIDFDPIYHPVQFDKIIEAMGLKVETINIPKKFYQPQKGISRIAIWKK